MAITFSPLVDAQSGDSVSHAINRLDRYGRKQGVWLNEYPERMGEDPYVEFGSYSGDEKVGTWYKMDQHGGVTAIEQFAHNVLNGEVKYFDQGMLAVTGYYRGLNPAYAFDTLVVADAETGEEKLVTVSTDRRTVKDGTWRYYDPATGRLIREEVYQVDELLSQRSFGLSTQDSLYYSRRNAILPHNLHHNNYTPGHEYRPFDKRK